MVGARAPPSWAFGISWYVTPLGPPEIEECGDSFQRWSIAASLLHECRPRRARGGEAMLPL